MSMRVTAIAPWFGAKRVMADRIVAELGPHQAYWEPFCGSMAVLLNKPTAPMETVNDLHGDVINLARVVRDPVDGPRLYRRLRRLLMHEGIFQDARALVVGDDTASAIDRAEAFFLASWMGRNGVAGTSNYNYAFCPRYTRNGGHAATRFRNAVASIPAWRRRLRDVTILQRDAIELIERVEDQEGTVIYADPPYVAKGAQYLHDFTADDHRALAAVLYRFERTRVVVSYYPHPLVDELYGDRWTRCAHDVSKAMSHQGRRGEVDVRANELLLINGPSVAEEGLFA